MISVDVPRPCVLFHPPAPINPSHQQHSCGASAGRVEQAPHYGGLRPARAGLQPKRWAGFSCGALWCLFLVTYRMSSGNLQHIGPRQCFASIAKGHYCDDEGMSTVLKATPGLEGERVLAERWMCRVSLCIRGMRSLVQHRLSFLRPLSQGRAAPFALAGVLGVVLRAIGGQTGPGPFCPALV